MISSKALARKIFVPFLATLMVAGLSAGFASPAKADATTKQVIIHYQKIGATTFAHYSNLDLYLWTGLSGDFAPNGNDSYGKIFNLTVDSSVNLLEGLIKTGSGWNRKDGGDNANRSFALNASGTTEIWLVSGKTGSNVYTSAADAVANGGATLNALVDDGVDPNYSCNESNVCTPIADRVVTIHYQKKGASTFNDYKYLDFYFWSGLSGDFAPSGNDSFGKIWTLNVPISAGNTLAGLIKTGWTGDWSNKDGGNNANRSLTINASGNTELWLVSDDGTGANTGSTVFSSVADAVANGGATADAFTSTGDDPNFACDEATGLCVPFISMPSEQVVTIHFQIPGATGFSSYKKLRVQPNLDGSNAVFNSSDDWGKVYTTTLTNASKKLKFAFAISESGWANKVLCDKCTGGYGKSDRTIDLDPSGTNEVWVVAGLAEQFYASKAAAVAAGADSTAPWSAGATDPFINCSGGTCTAAPLYPATQSLTIHYNRPDNNYTGWNVWNWGSPTSADDADDAAGRKNYPFTQFDNFGAKITLNFAGNASNSGQFGFLLRKSVTGNKWAAQTQDYAAVVAENPGAASGTTEVWVVHGKSTVYTSNPYGVPTVSSAGLPASVGFGKSFEVTGTNFPADGNISVRLVGTASGSNPAPTATALARVLSATKLAVTLPSVFRGFTGKLNVTTPGGSATTTGSVALTATKVVPGTPTLSPAFGVVGTTVTVTGTNAGAARTVSLGGVEVPFTVTGINSLTFVVPAGADDSKVGVDTEGGTVYTAKNFALVPSITGIPASAAINSDITITGVNLKNVTGAKIGTKALVIKTKGSTSITATVPAGSATGKISVTSAGGTALSSGNLSIIPVPTITSVTGTKVGSAFKAGTTVTITGTGLTGATVVRFGANTISGFSVVSSTSITFTAPASKTGTSVSVVTPGGTGVKNGAVSTTAS